jgi:excisionase family DNA binding protein
MNLSKIPEQHRERVRRTPAHALEYMRGLGIDPQTEEEWNVLLTATNRLLPNPLPKPYPDADDLFAEGMFKVAEAAQHLRLNRATIYRAMKRGELPYYKMGKCTRIPRKALRIWTEAY